MDALHEPARRANRVLRRAFLYKGKEARKEPDSGWPPRHYDLWLQERGNGGLTKLRRMAFIVEIDESLGPMDIRFFRAATVMRSSYRATQPIQETGAVRIV